MERQGSGSIVITSSVAGSKGAAQLSAYSASKHAVVGPADCASNSRHFMVAQAHRYASAATLGPFLFQQIIYMTVWAGCPSIRCPGCWSSVVPRQWC